MTLIALRVEEQQVQFLDDCPAYGPGCVVLDLDVQKVRVLPAVEGDFAAYGPAEPGEWWQEATSLPEVVAGGFDDLHRCAPNALLRVWALAPHRTGARGTGGVLQAGWSRARGGSSATSTTGSTAAVPSRCAPIRPSRSRRTRLCPTPA